MLRCTGMRSITPATLRLDQFTEAGSETGALLLKRMATLAACPVLGGSAGPWNAHSPSVEQSISPCSSSVKDPLGKKHCNTRKNPVVLAGFLHGATYSVLPSVAEISAHSPDILTPTAKASGAFVAQAVKLGPVERARPSVCRLARVLCCTVTLLSLLR
jgi:hypothetical protein